MSAPPGARRASITPPEQTTKQRHKKLMNQGFSALTKLFTVSAQSERQKRKERKECQTEEIKTPSGMRSS